MNFLSKISGNSDIFLNHFVILEYGMKIYAKQFESSKMYYNSFYPKLF